MRPGDDTEPSRVADLELARRAMAGDRAAFGRLVHHHQGLVYRVCQRLIPEEAEDLTQETFMRAFVQRERFDPERAIAPWLVTIARHLCLDRLRRLRPELDPDAAAALPDPSRDAESTFEARRALKRVQRGLAALPPLQREAFLLFAQDGLRYRDIADAMEVPLGTIMTWLHRARQALREAVEPPVPVRQESHV